MYVACTRARDTLRVSWNGKPSPFLQTGERGDVQVGASASPAS